VPTELPKPGDVLSDRYDVIRVIGEGGMGVVYEGTHRRIGQRVAIKVLHPAMMSSPDIVERFEREARAAGHLKSGHAVRVMDVDVTAGGLPYMVMEFLEGRDLEQEVLARGALPIDEAVDYLWQTCGAMAEAHDLGIVHRDLKPANLFLCPDQGKIVVKILDFGISKMTRDTSVSVTSTASSIGTPLYMSPEQVRSSKTVDARTDIWSLGVIAYELLGGRVPFSGANPTAVVAAIVADEAPPLRSLRPEVPIELERVVHKALAKDVALRYPDVRALAIALGPFIRGGPVSIAGINSADAFAPTLSSGLSRAAPPAGSPPVIEETSPRRQLPDARPPTAKVALSTPSWSIEPRRTGGRVLVPLAVVASCLLGAAIYFYPSSSPTAAVPGPAPAASTSPPALPSASASAGPAFVAPPVVSANPPSSASAAVSNSPPDTERPRPLRPQQPQPARPTIVASTPLPLPPPPPSATHSAAVPPAPPTSAPATSSSPPTPTEPPRRL
jgi:serine/threonine-protein kinase